VAVVPSAMGMVRGCMSVSRNLKSDGFIGVDGFEF